MANENAITKIQLKTKISPNTGDDKVELSEIDLAQGEPLVNTNDNTVIIGTSNVTNSKANDSGAIILGYSRDDINNNIQETSDDPGITITHYDGNKERYTRTVKGTWSQVTSDDSGNITIDSTPELALIDGTNTVNISITGPNNTKDSELIDFSITGDDYTRVNLDDTSVKISSVIGSHVTIGNNGSANGGWYKVASGLVSGTNDASFIFNVVTAFVYNNTYTGTLKFWLRNDDRDTEEYYKDSKLTKINWIDRVSSNHIGEPAIDENSAVVFYKLAEDKSRYWELFMYLPDIEWFLTTVELVSARTREGGIPNISFNLDPDHNYGQDLDSLKLNIFNNWFNDDDHKAYSDVEAKINHITDYHFIESAGQPMLFHSVDVESGCTFGSKDSSIELKADSSSPYLKLKNTTIRSTSNGLKITVN